jgi:hypothetical protein
LRALCLWNSTSASPSSAKARWALFAQMPSFLYIGS